MNTFINLVSIAPFVFELSSMLKEFESRFATTGIEIDLGLANGGSNGLLGGNVPHIALWNADGTRLGQNKPKGKMDPQKSPWTAEIPHIQGGDGQAEYVYLVAGGNDAICITSISASGNGAQWTWMGDIGYKCGGDWYPSTAKYGDDNYQPKCTWIDGDHTNGLRFIGMSMHIPDFNGDQGLAQEYNDNEDTLCNSKARFMQWGQVPTNPGQDFIPPMFHPPLQYNETDGSDLDIDALFRPGTVREKKRDTVSLPVTDSTAGMHGHVIISDYRAHSAQEVCSSKTSRGPSFVSTEEGYYCDMSTKTVYPLCNDKVTTACFDDSTHQLRGQRLHARDLTGQIKKSYSSSDRWTPSN